MRVILTLRPTRTGTKWSEKRSGCASGTSSAATAVTSFSPASCSFMTSITMTTSATGATSFRCETAATFCLFVFVYMKVLRLCPLFIFVFNWLCEKLAQSEKFSFLPRAFQPPHLKSMTQNIPARVWLDVFRCVISCVISNAFGTVTSTQERLRVYTMPKINEKPVDHTVKNGSSVVFNCQATGHPRPVISWLKVIDLLPFCGRSFITSRACRRQLAMLWGED